MKSNLSYYFLFIISFHVSGAYAQKTPEPPPPLVFKDGRLIYTPDSLGNRIPDFSHAGYAGGDQTIPYVDAVMAVPLEKGDATDVIQYAIDKVSEMPLKANGFRGAVLLGKGVYQIEGSLFLRVSGIVIRGSGAGSGGTVLKGAGRKRDAIIVVSGEDSSVKGPSFHVENTYMPVGSHRVTLKNHTLEPGDEVQIERPFTENWIRLLGTEHFGGGITSLGWKPLDRSIVWNRMVKEVKGNEVVLDAPVTTALDTAFGGGTVTVYVNPGRLKNIGIENMSLVSEFDSTNAKDEDHRWMAITMDQLRDGWVRQITFRHFAGSAVHVGSGAQRITVEDCISTAPVGEGGGWRRNTFFTEGQQTLFQRCYAENGMHDFSVGYCAAGPNVFVQCESVLPHAFSGSINSWASGILMDVVNVDGNALSYKNLGQDKNGAGWAAANSVFWNCSAARIDCCQPPTAQNWAFGSWSQFAGDGYWNESNNTIQPRSLYYQQLKERLRDRFDAGREQLYPLETSATSSPTYEQAEALTREAEEKRIAFPDWILEANKRNVIQVDLVNVKKVNPDVPKGWHSEAGLAKPLSLRNGMLSLGNDFAAGSRYHVQWWSGNLRDKGIAQARPHITRFVPGKTGTGFTDDLEELVWDMKENNTLAIDHNYGLWYERRRDDHERVRRMDGDVWAPFYELPFARSGIGTAWDGLSKYDLTKFNAFYWGRLKQFAELAEDHGKILLHQHYFQHNILEAGAHYADFPWRTANNINNTPFPEPVPYAGDKRIFMDEQFYDVSDSAYRSLHQGYIRKCLENFSGDHNVIHLIGEEFTGPLRFVQFWIDEIAAWQRETGRDPLVALSVTKDVQDAILNDAKRAEIIDIIDIKYWHWQSNGELYAPQGGKHLAPRQHARVLKPKGSSPEGVYKAVKEYRERYSGKAVMYSGDGYDRFGWAALMAGASMPPVEVQLNGWVNEPFTTTENPDKKIWMLRYESGNQLFHFEKPESTQVDLSGKKGDFRYEWINRENGEVIETNVIAGGGKHRLEQPSEKALVLWVYKIHERK